MGALPFFTARQRDDVADADDGGVDAATDAGPDADAGDAGSDAVPTDAGGDAGPQQPYCANTNNDPTTAGGCGVQCKVNHTCTNAFARSRCGAGTIACLAADKCLNIGACCTTADCTITTRRARPRRAASAPCPTGRRLRREQQPAIPGGTLLHDG